MRCHYEVLGVAQNAEDAEIKKQYRKLALQNHPDKNPDRVDECTKLFHDIQAAYDVLSDKQERAWYDKHREAILKGGDDYVDDSIDVMHYFNPAVYSGYNDGPEGFYTVFRDAFRKISEEDEPYLESDSDYEVPEFGDSTSDYDQTVKAFYSHWLGYCTKKSYVWKEKYDIRQAPNRPTQRLMEKENKKLRDISRKKRNEEVRALVSYVRKRDKRVQAYRKELELKQAEQKLKLEQKIAEDKKNRNKLLDNYQEQEWMVFDHMKLDNIDSHFDEEFGNSDTGSDNSDFEKVEHFYCIACDKTFKSEKALTNHEKSKKHKENVNLIKNEMEDDLLADLHIEEKKTLQEDDSNLNIDSDFQRLNSLNLPENVVKLNVIEKTEVIEDKCDSSESLMQRHSMDSLKLTKMKGTSSHEGSVKRKEKKKESKQHDNEDAFVACHQNHPGLYAKDSLVLPRKKSKKQEVRDSADRVRTSGEPDAEGMLAASLHGSCLTDSIKINKRRSKADRKKGRRKLLNIDEDNGVDDDVFITLKSEANQSQSSDDSNNSDSEEGDSKPLLNRSTITDSIRYNKGKMEHHGKNLLNYQKNNSKNDKLGNEEIMKKSENGNDLSNNIESGVCLDNTSDDNHEQLKKGGDLKAQLKRTVVLDSIRYNKNKIEHHGKHLIQYKKILKDDGDDLDMVSDSLDKENYAKEENIESHNIKSNKKKDKKTKNRQDTGELFKCSVCGKDYPTRNMLFSHIKTEGHAIAKQVSIGKGKKVKTKQK